MKRLSIAAAVLLCASVAILIFFPAIGAGFLSDDWHWLWLADRQSSVWPDWTANYAGGHVGGSYNPLSSLWMNVHYALFGLNAIMFHLGSILLHGINTYLVFVLSRSLCKTYLSDIAASTRRSVPWAAALIFLVWPTHTEAVSWIAAVPHLLASFGVLVTLTAYLHYRSRHQAKWLIVSFVGASIALFSKETAIIIPVLIIIMEAWHQSVHRRVTLRLLLTILAYCGLTIMYIGARWYATGLTIGTYAESTIIVRPMVMVHTLLTGPLDLIAGGVLRQSWTALYFGHAALVALVTGIVLCVGIMWCVRRCGYRMLWLIALMSVALMPILTVGFSRTTFEGERYTYMASVFFCIILGIVVRTVKYRSVITFLVLIGALALTVPRSMTWSLSGSVARQAIGIVQRSDSRRVFAVGMPDTVGGAQCMRNNLREAISLLDPSSRVEIELLPAYVEVPRRERPTIRWTSDDRGFTAKTDGRYLVTGRDRTVSDLATLELWNYDYTTFRSDTIRMLVDQETRRGFDDGSIALIGWTEGNVARIQP